MYFIDFECIDGFVGVQITHVTLSIPIWYEIVTCLYMFVYVVDTQ
jgi:hypothetical protein